MPHLSVVYTPNLQADFQGLCTSLCATINAMREADGKQAFPIGGTRVMAFPAAYYAVADASQDHPFLYMNLRIWAGRSPELVKDVSEKLLAVAKEFLADTVASQPIGITIQVDETPPVMPGPLVQSFEDRHNTLHALFRK